MSKSYIQVELVITVHYMVDNKAYQEVQVVCYCHSVQEGKACRSALVCQSSSSRASSELALTFPWFPLHLPILLLLHPQLHPPAPSDPPDCLLRSGSSPLRCRCCWRSPVENVRYCRMTVHPGLAETSEEKFPNVLSSITY